jgi:hypothetical protein
VVEGHLIMWLHGGKNVAWCYLDYEVRESGRLVHAVSEWPGATATQWFEVIATRATAPLAH